MAQSGVDELRHQLKDLDEETKSLKEMASSIENLEDKLEANRIARARLKRKMIEAGHRL